MSTLPFFLYYFLHQWSLTDIYSTFLSLLFATKSMTSSVFLRSLLPVRGEHVTVMALCAHSLVLKYIHRATPAAQIIPFVSVLGGKSTALRQKTDVNEETAIFISGSR